MQRSPLHAVYQALGATFTEVAGWERPQHFGNPAAEYRAVRESVGLCEPAPRGWVRLTGKDRQRFLHAMVSNDTASLQPGQGCYATFLTNKGKIVADFVVYAEADAYLLELESHVVQPLIEAMSWFVISEDVELHNDSEQWGVLSAQGPKAAQLLTLALGQAVPDLPLYGHAVCALAGQHIRLFRRSHTGAPGYQLLAPPLTLPALWDVLWQHRAACGVEPVGVEVLEALRIEAGIPVCGCELTDETIPVEANLGHAISYTKGCYIGQEVIARIEARGHVNRKLVGLRLGGAALPAPGAKIIAPEREVGWVTSAAYSPGQGQAVALGYVRREVWAPGTQLAVQTPEATMPATVVELPFSAVQNRE